MSPFRIWLMAARPRTLPAAVAPVLVGTALAATLGTFKVLTFIATLLGALFIQIGANLSNDYSDARRGADTEDRLGPVRVTAGGLVPPKQVLIATYVAFGLAVLVGAYLVATAGWQILAIGAASILAGVLYTGGPRPYGYEGLGEVFVFLFFGVAAVTGTYFAQREEWAWESFALAVPVGLLATAILMVNNIRDLETDRRAGKRTLAVRLGRAKSAHAVRGDRLRRVPHRARRVARGRRGALPVAAAAVARAPAGRSDRPHGAQPRRRALAQRRAREDRHAPARVLRAAVGRPAGELMLTVRTVRFPVRIDAAWGSLREREILHVRLDFEDGTYGEGEAAPLEPYDGVSTAAVRAALDAYARLDAPPDRLLEACRSERDLPQALAAIDLALWDRRARLEDTSIAKLICRRRARRDPRQRDDRRRGPGRSRRGRGRAAEQGFTCVKVKVGIGDDAGRLAAVRAAAPDVLIRVDANGAWATPAEALANLRALAPIGIELCEEPIHGAQALAEVRAESPVPIACDETFAPEAVDVVCLKIARGGITAALEAASRAEDVYLASSYDGPLGLRAAAHVAAGLRVTRHCGLATGELEVHEGMVAMP